MNLPFLWLLCAMRKCPFGLLNVWDCHLLLLRLKIVANCRWGCRWAWGWRFVFVLSCSFWFSVAFLKVCHQDLFHKAYNRKPISLKIQKYDPHQEPFNHPRLSHPKRDNLPLRHTAHPTTPWSPTLTPHRDAFLHHLWGGVALYSVWEIGPDKRKWGIREEGGRTLLTYPVYSRPAHFLSRVAGSGDIVHRPDYTPNHQRSQLGTLPRRIVGVSMTNGTRHDPCIPRHWAMRCPAWTLTRTSHNRVVNKIRPNTDVASISSVLHLVWPLAQSLSSMVVPTRSQNSSWHSLWDLRGTQAPQLRQSNNTLGGIKWANSLVSPYHVSLVGYHVSM